jgi:hypothetical protein
VHSYPQQETRRTFDYSCDHFTHRQGKPVATEQKNVQNPKFLFGSAKNRFFWAPNRVMQPQREHLRSHRLFQTVQSILTQPVLVILRVFLQTVHSILTHTVLYCILASCYIRFTLNICSFVHQCKEVNRQHGGHKDNTNILTNGHWQ